MLKEILDKNRGRWLNWLGLTTVQDDVSNLTYELSKLKYRLQELEIRQSNLEQALKLTKLHM